MSSKNIQEINSFPNDTLNETNQNFLSDYNILGIIGKGTFSVVKLGENKLTKERVAIKIMQKNKIINQKDLIRIQREIEMVKVFNHPNVIKIYKILEDPKKIYIIMEYCENGELFHYIVDKQRLSEDEAALFYYQLINGLEYIHKNKIVHRDLKPENLLLSKNDILKIIDFGLSNYSKFDDILLGTPCGSPCYASPEMVRGQKYNGFLIDIWSTGIILFAMICGYLPFEDNNNDLLFGKILNCKINYPNYIGEIALDLMKKIIVKDPSKRITLQEIKEHPFYLRGKLLFSSNYSDIFNDYNNLHEATINNNNNHNIIHLINPRNNKNKENKDIIQNNNSNNCFNNNIEKLKFDYKAYKTKKIELNGIFNFDKYNNAKTYNNYNNQTENNKYETLNLFSKNYDLYNEDKNKNIIRKSFINNENENVNENITKKSNNKNDFLNESDSDSLNSSEIPKDTIPKEYNEHNNNISNKEDIKIVTGKNLNIKNNVKEQENNNGKEEELISRNSIGIHNIQKNNNYNNIRNIYINSNINNNIKNNNNDYYQKINKNIEKSSKPKGITTYFSKIILNKNNKEAGFKTPSNLNNYKNMLPNKNNRINEKTLADYFTFKKENKSYIVKPNTFFLKKKNSFFNNSESNMGNMPKYSISTFQVLRTSYNSNDKTNTILNSKNGIIMNEFKPNFSSNSCPKNNYKLKFFLKNRSTKHNITKIKKKIIKNIERQTPQNNYNTFNLNNIKEENRKQNNINLVNINSNYNKINNRLNLNTMNENNNISTNNEKKNKMKIMDIFKELQLFKSIKNEISEYNNRGNHTFNNNFNKINSLYDDSYNNVFSFRKSLNKTPVKDINFFQKKDFYYNSNKLIERINTQKNYRKLSPIINKKINNYFNINYENYKNKMKIINKESTNKDNNSNVLDNKLHLSKNRPILIENIRDIKNKYFTMSNNSNKTISNDSKNYNALNNINFKENKFENLKICNIKYKSKNLLKEEKINNNIKHKNVNKKNNIEQTKKKLKTKINNVKYIGNKNNKNNNINTLYFNKKYISYNFDYSDDFKKNKYKTLNNSIKNINKNKYSYNYNLNLLDKIKMRNINNNKIYNLNDLKKKNNYNIKSNDMILNTKNKNKEKNNKFTINKSTNIINNYYNNINNLTNNNIISKTTRNRNSINNNKNINLKNLNINIINNNGFNHSIKNNKYVIDYNKNLNNRINTLYNSIISHSTINNKALIDNNKYNFSFRYKNIGNTLPKEMNLNVCKLRRDKINNDENKPNSKYFTYNTNSPEILKEKSNSIFSNSNFIFKGKSFFSNDGSKIKLLKKKKNYCKINDNCIKNKENEKYKYASIKNMYNININPFRSNKTLNTIVTDISHSPFSCKFYPNIKKYKKFVKQYCIGK